MTDTAPAEAHEEAPHDARSFDLTVGTIVWYRLSEADADHINRTFPTRNLHHEGQVLAATIVAVYRHKVASLQAFIDGQGLVWLASRPESTTGRWNEGSWRYRR